MRRATTGLPWGGAVVGSGPTMRQCSGATVRILVSQCKLFIHQKLLQEIGNPTRILLKRGADGLQRILASPDQVRGWKLTYVSQEAHCSFREEGAGLLGLLDDRVFDECVNSMWVGEPDLTVYAGDVYLCIVIRPQC